jgi:hypothetical protein
VDNVDLKILQAIKEKASDRFVNALPLVNDLRMSEEELGDRLWMLDDSGFINAAGKGGTTAPGMTLSNGIHNVRLTANGRQFLRRSDIS